MPGTVPGTVQLSKLQLTTDNSDINLTSIIPVYLTRYFSLIRIAHFTLVRTQSNYPEYLALEHNNVNLLLQP